MPQLILPNYCAESLSKAIRCPVHQLHIHKFSLHSCNSQVGKRSVADNINLLLLLQWRDLSSVSSPCRDELSYLLRFAVMLPGQTKSWARCLLGTHMGISESPVFLCLSRFTSWHFFPSFSSNLFWSSLPHSTKLSNCKALPPLSLKQLGYTAKGRKKKKR